MNFTFDLLIIKFLNVSVKAPKDSSYCVAGLDFDPLGALAATFDIEGVCLISDINTNNYSHRMKISTRPWNGNHTISLSIGLEVLS